MNMISCASECFSEMFIVSIYLSFQFSLLYNRNSCLQQLPLEIFLCKIVFQNVRPPGPHIINITDALLGGCWWFPFCLYGTAST